LTLLRRQGDLPDDGGQRKQTERIRHLGQQTQRNTSPRLLLKTAVIGGKKNKTKKWTNQKENGDCSQKEKICLLLLHLS
jgi:hypothetical protein